MAGKFPIGFWNYPSISVHGAEEVERWTRCGMTVNQSPRFHYDTDEKERMLALLDECEKQGMRLYLCVGELDYRDAQNDLAAYRRTFEQAYADFGHHPATAGFFIGDEPIGIEQLNACIAAYRIHLSLAPELTPFLNFNPYVPGFEERFLGGMEFPLWAKDFTERSGCRLICYDCYTQLNPEEDGTDLYFLNLKKYSEMAREAGVELWTTLLSVGHFRYRVPSEDDLRWQLNTAAASGCRGILWFLFYNPMPGNNYRLSPVDEFGEETEVYRSMARVQKRFHAMHGDLLSSLRHRKTWHFGKCYGTYDHFPQDTHPLIKRMHSVDRLPGILSFFENAEGREYAVLVSNTPFEPGRFEFVLDKKVKHIHRLEMNGSKDTDFAAHHHDAIYHEEYDAIHAGVWLAPGQMEIFRFE